MPVVEVYSCIPSQAYLDDASIINLCLRRVTHIPGCLSIYHGLSGSGTGLDKRLYATVTWEKYEDHQTYMKMDVFPEIRDQSRVVIGGDERMHHVEFSGDSTVAFNGLLTEFTTMVLREGRDVDSLRAALKELSNAIKSASDGATEPVFGETVEVAGMFILVSAWESAERAKSVKENVEKEFKAVEAFAEVEMVYATFEEITDPGEGNP